MRRLLLFLLQKVNLFLELSPTDTDQQLAQKREEFFQTIQLAIRTKAALHVIYDHQSFTGEIVKWDPNRQQLILKNFKQNVTSLIDLPAIQRISVVPEAIREVQKKNL